MGRRKTIVTYEITVTEYKLRGGMPSQRKYFRDRSYTVEASSKEDLINRAKNMSDYVTMSAPVYAGLGLAEEYDGSYTELTDENFKGGAVILLKGIFFGDNAD